MRLLRGALFSALLAAAFPGCAPAHLKQASPPRPGIALPEAFLVATPDGLDAPRDDGACRSPLVDPNDGTRLFLVRSQGGYGEYVVPPGKYGAVPGELLRVRCADGRPVGFVPEYGGRRRR